MAGAIDEDHHRSMGEEAVAVEHDLIAVADAGFGEQAYCSCGWRTAPKGSSRDASVIWRTHMTSRVTAQLLAAG